MQSIAQLLEQIQLKTSLTNTTKIIQLALINYLATLELEEIQDEDTFTVTTYLNQISMIPNLKDE